MPLFWRLCVIVAATISAVVALFVALAVVQFNQIRSELERDRLAVLADRVAAPFEAAARIGLPLDAVRNAGAILERSAQMEDAVTAVNVLSPSGEIIHSIGVNSASSWELPEASAERRWSGETDSGFFSGIRINDSSGSTVGGLVIEYSGADSAARSWAMAAQLAVAGAVLVPMALVGGAMALKVLLRREVDFFDAVEAELGAFERRSWRPGFGPETAAEAVEEGRIGLFRLISAVENEYREAARLVAGEAKAP